MGLPVCIKCLIKQILYFIHDRTKCGATPRYRVVKDDEGHQQHLREPCLHSSLNWVHMACCLADDCGCD